MVMNNYKIGTRLFALITLAVLFLILLGSYGMYRLSLNNDILHEALNKLDKSSTSINLARSAQVAFKKQVQEWKDLLIRGNDPTQFKKYLEAFKKEHQNTQNDLQALKKLVVELNFDTGKINDTMKAHTALLEKYNNALQKFNPADEGTGKVVDKIVAGMDRETTNSIDAIVDEIISENHKMQAKISSESETQYTDARTKSTLCIIVALLTLGSISLYVIKTITGPLGKSVAFSEAVATGNLEAQLDISGSDETSVLARSLKQMVINLKIKINDTEEKSQLAFQESQKANAALGEADAAKKEAEAKTDEMLRIAQQLEGVVAVLTSASENLSAQIENSSHGAEEQSHRASETATAMEEMNATVFEVAKNASQAADTAGKAKQKAESGAAIVSQVVTGIADVQKQALALKTNMTTLGQQAQGIGQIINVINEIADQTNLLALNAAIEAARAGEAGRGFAVVADEVRKLAEKTMAATKEVGDAIHGIQDGTTLNIANVEQAVTTIDAATDLATQSGESLTEIVTLVDMTTDQVQAIAAASEQQSAASEEINRSIEDINRISTETSDAMRQSAVAVSELSEQSLTLKSLIEAMQSGERSHVTGHTTPKSARKVQPNRLKTLT